MVHFCWQNPPKNVNWFSIQVPGRRRNVTNCELLCVTVCMYVYFYCGAHPAFHFLEHHFQRERCVLIRTASSSRDRPLCFCKAYATNDRLHYMYIIIKRALTGVLQPSRRRRNVIDERTWMTHMPVSTLEKPQRMKEISMLSEIVITGSVHDRKSRAQKAKTRD